MERPVISIVCIVYNQEQICMNAFDSFIDQVTTYPFEVVIHDDASSDSTANIIEKYCERYPKIFRAILQTENQYSRGNSPTQIAIEHARGKYIALCEGDDYWSDVDKLQNQIDYLEDHPECTFCFSNGIRIDSNTGESLGKMLPANRREKRILNKRCIDAGEMLQIGFPPTGSFVFRKSDYIRRPVFSNNAYQGDRYLQLVLSAMGYAYYLDKETVCYRTNNPNSVMGSWGENKKKLIENCNEVITMYKEFDRFTGGKYSKRLTHYITLREGQLLLAEGNDLGALAPKYLAAYLAEGPIPFLKHMLHAIRQLDMR